MEIQNISGGMQLRKHITAVKTGSDPHAMRRQAMGIASQTITVLLEEDPNGVDGQAVMDIVLGVLKEADSTIDWEKQGAGLKRVLVEFLAIVFDPDMTEIVADTHSTILKAND